MKLCTLFLILTLTWGQSPSKSVVGEVTGVDGAAKQFNVKGDDGANYIVVFDVPPFQAGCDGNRFAH